MVDTPITIPPPQQDDFPLYLADGTAPVLTPTPQVADVRSQKAYMGLGDVTKMSQDDIRAQIQSGQEQQFRDAAASSIAYQQASTRDQTLIDARNKKGSALTYDEAMYALNPNWNPDQTPFDAPVASPDPHDVIERAYAEKFTGMASTAASYMRGTVLDDASTQIPLQVKQAEDNTSSLTAIQEIARTYKENIDNDVANQGWIPWAADQAKDLFQPYVEYKLRGLNPNVGSVSGGILLGSNLKAQADDLVMRYGGNPTVFKDKLQSIVEPLREKNPGLASQFVGYVQGQSTNQRLLDSAFTILAPLDFAEGVKLTASLAKKVTLYNRVNTAFRQAVETAAKQDPTIPVKAIAQEALGDVDNAALTRASDHIAKAMSGSLDPIQDTKESLTSNFRLDGDLADTNPGKLTAGQMTELKNSFYAKGNDLFDKITTMLRVMRTPVPLASEDALRAYQDAARNDIHDAEGLLDIGSPIRDAASNTYHVPFTYGTPDRKLFSDPETAYNYARQRGYADPRIFEAGGDVVTKASKPIMTAKDFARKNFLERSIAVGEEGMAQLKHFVGPKFIGPRSAEDITRAKAELENYSRTLKGYRDELGEIGKRVRHSDPVIEQNGLGYKFTVFKPYNETDDVIRSYLTSDSKAKSSAAQTGFGSWVNAIAGKFRGADETLAFNEAYNRKIATYTQAVIQKWAHSEAKEIEAIANQSKWYQPWTYHKKFTNREQFQQFNEVLKYAKTVDDPATGLKGYFFKTPGELEDHYQRYYQRLPSFQEVKAYFANVKLVEGNRVLSEIAEFRNRARLGAEQHQIFTMAADGTRKASGFFDGVEKKEFPSGGGQILIMGGKEGDERLYHLGANEIPGRNIQQYREAVQTGKAKIIEIFDPDTLPLKGFVGTGGERIRYVMVTDAESKPLAFNHVNRRGGGHFDYDATQYIKQANVVDEKAGSALADKRRVFKRIYTGDKTLMAGSGIRSQDEAIAKMMNDMNVLMREGREEEAKSLSKKLGIPWDKMSEWYNPNRFLNGVKVGPHIDWNEPFYVVPRNKRIYDVDTKGLVDRLGGEDTFQDASKTGSLAKQFQVEYSQARDADGLFTLNDVGTAGNPIYKMAQAAFVDPIPTLNRALTRAIRSTFMDDYKISAVEHWLQEASPYLKAETSELRSAPFYHFNNVDEGAFTSATPWETKQNLLSNRFKIKQFLGMPNIVETATHSLTQHLVDTFYNKFGPEDSRNILQKAVSIVPLWALSRWQDPISGIRSLAFNAKLGMFALPQFLTQAQTFANIWALGGRNAVHGTMATMLHQWSRINKSEAFMKSYDDLYTKMNLFGSRARPGEFIEANNELSKTGFEHVGGEYQLADDQMQYRMIKGDFSNFLDAGQVFFREGEKATRLGAWYTAFREFRDANPVKVLTDADRSGILARADLLTANMSRASASALNQSIFSLPMQFLTYQVRMAELFWGKRLGETVGERTINRARLLGMYAALYGAPGALGVTGYPFASSIREEAINKGYVPGDNQFTDAVMNGLIAWQLALITGKGDYQKGQQYDVQGRWGTQGMTAISESMRSDKTVWSLIGGAGVDTLLSTVAHVDPFWQFARQMMSEDEEGNYFKLTAADMTNVFSEISSVDAAKRGIYALNTGRWITKNQNYVEDVPAWDVLIREITGFKSQDQADIQSFHNIKEAEEEAQKDATKKIIIDYRRGLDATRDKDYDTAKTYFTNARARIISAGIPLDRRSAIFAQASRGYEAQTMTSEWDWATKNVPYTPGGTTADTRMNAFITRRNLQQNRNQ